MGSYSGTFTIIIPDDVPNGQTRHDTLVDRNDGNRETENGTAREGGRERRRPGVLFWVLIALLSAATVLNAMEGDLLQVGVFLALGLYLVLDRTTPWESSPAWGRARGASSAAFGLLAVLLLVRELGLV